LSNVCRRFPSISEAKRKIEENDDIHFNLCAGMNGLLLLPSRAKGLVKETITKGYVNLKSTGPFH